MRVQKYGFNRPDPTSQFLGIYLQQKAPSSPLSVDLYWLTLDRKQSVWGERPGPEKRHTLGFRLAGETPVRRADFDLEAAYQVGTHASADIRAYMLTAQLGYQLPRAPVRVQTALDYASGDDDPSDGQIGTFNQMFPLGHAYLGFIDVVGRQNVLDFNQRVSLQASPRFRLMVDGHLFWRAKANDALYNPGGAVVRGGQTDSSRYTGSELDWTFAYAASRHATATFGYSHFFPGQFIRETGSDEAIDFVYLMFQFTF